MQQLFFNVQYLVSLKKTEKNTRSNHFTLQVPSSDTAHIFFQSKF